MKVEELIAILQQHDPDRLVVIRRGQGGRLHMPRVTLAGRDTPASPGAGMGAIRAIVVIEP